MPTDFDPSRTRTGASPILASPAAVPAPALGRQTVAAPALIAGRGLFTGAPVRLTIRPAERATPPDSGYGFVFRRADLPGSPEIPARVGFVSPEPRRTVLCTAGSGPTGGVQTVEHILSAFVGLGVTDAVLELDGPEIPIGDGSASLFTDAISAVGTRPLAGTGPLTPLRIPRPLVVEAGSARVEAFPPEAPDDARCEYVYHLAYAADDAPLAPQTARWSTGPGSASRYLAEVAPARTFSLQAEAEAARKVGLFKDFGPADLLVIGADGHPIQNTLRFADEPGRHKLLDLIGDLALVGRPLIGRVVATRAGHALNHAMARAIVEAAAAG